MSAIAGDASEVLADPSRHGGAISRTIVKWFFRSGLVAEVAELSARFRLVTVEGEALRELAWETGQKIQIAVGPGLVLRTYTPISWDSSEGRTTLLSFAHGVGPGSHWTTALRRGDPCSFLGPRRSLDLAGLTGRTVLFGDETSFGLAASLRSTSPERRTSAIFEVSDPTEAAIVASKIGLAEARLVARGGDEAHLDAITREIADLSAREPGAILLTGKAPSIQHISRSLKAIGLGPRLKAKAYWAPGKAGLD